MKCMKCGSELELGARFCSECGMAVPDVSRSQKEFPQDVSKLIDDISVIMDRYENPSHEYNFDDSSIVMSPVVSNLPHNFKGRVFATDSISFAAPKEYELKFYYGDSKIVVAHFFNKVAFRRESTGDSYQLKFYTDYSAYTVGEDTLSRSKSQGMTRQPVIILGCDDRFFIYCGKDSGYLRIEEIGVNQNEITELDIGKMVYVGRNMRFCINQV